MLKFEALKGKWKIISDQLNFRWQTYYKPEFNENSINAFYYSLDLDKEM